MESVSGAAGQTTAVSTESVERISFPTRVKRAIGRRIRARIKDAFFFGVLPSAYRKAAKRPLVSGKVLFLENKEAKLPDSFQIMWDRLSAVPTLTLEFVSLGENRVLTGEYYRNCIDFVKNAATAQCIFLNDASNVVSCLPLRAETTVVQLWHGCGAFKKWGMSTADLIFGGTREEILRHPFYKNLSLVTVSSPEVVWAYEEAMILEDEPGVVCPIGVSRTDVFFDEEYLATARKKVRSLMSSNGDKRVIVYAPTFRGRVAQAEGPSELDLRAMKEALGESHILLIKHHPFVKNRPPVPQECADFAKDVTDDIGINELMCGADVVISDYSSLVFEYSLFERPMIFFAFDRNEYVDWRGFYYDYEQLAPGPICDTTDEVIAEIKLAETDFDSSRVRTFRKKFMSACDGRATDRIISRVFGNSAMGFCSDSFEE